jgi:hypothetical protein
MATVFWDCKCLLLVDFLDIGNTVTAECYFGTGLVSNSLRCCGKVVSLYTKTPGLLLSTRLVNGCSTTDEKIWTILPTVPILCPVISITVDTLSSTWLARNLQHMPT